MKRSVSLATALAVALASGSLPTLALAKGLFTRASYNAPPQPTQAMPMQGQSMMPGKSMMTGRMPSQQMETLPTPPGATSGGAMMHSQGGYYNGNDTGSPFVDDSNGENYGGGYGYGGGNCNCDSGYCGCDDGCTYGDCGSCGDCYGCGDCCDSSSSSWWDCFDCCNLGGSGGQQRHWYFTADYLYVRANFSQATAFVIHDDSGTPLEFSDTYYDLNFRHDSSYRVGGGYYLGCCDEQLRFMYTRMTSDAGAFTDNPDALGPFETSPGPGGTLNVNANVNSNSWDLEYAKTIPLGGGCCECGDACSDPCGSPCGCGDACCPPACPAWDITWSGGVRFADVDWSRRYLSNNPQTEFIRDTRTTMDFQGGGPKVGLEGRRYFGDKRWCSLYLKGDISVLLGNLQFDITRVSSDGNPPDVTERQDAHFRNIIPVTEIEAGGTAQLSKSSRFTAGYLFSAWHDLGFRDQFNFSADAQTSFLETSYDDANILGWDGFFARFEYCY